MDQGFASSAVAVALAGVVVDVVDAVLNTSSTNAKQAGAARRSANGKSARQNFNPAAPPNPTQAQRDELDAASLALAEEIVTRAQRDAQEAKFRRARGVPDSNVSDGALPVDAQPHVRRAREALLAAFDRARLNGPVTASSFVEDNFRNTRARALQRAFAGAYDAQFDCDTREFLADDEWLHADAVLRKVADLLGAPHAFSAFDFDFCITRGMVARCAFPDVVYGLLFDPDAMVRHELFESSVECFVRHEQVVRAVAWEKRMQANAWVCRDDDDNDVDDVDDNDDTVGDGCEEEDPRPVPHHDPVVAVTLGDSAKRWQAAAPSAAMSVPLKAPPLVGVLRAS